MCGIVGAVARRDVVPVLLEGIKQLEYRGYDSAGIAVINGSLHRLRSAGRVADLRKLAAQQSLSGFIGIAHTRWATHGAPSERNAHPHVSSGIAVVHNGIIENHEEIRRQLRSAGYVFSSDTDTEVIAHLIHSELQCTLDLFAAVRLVLLRLRGAYAIAVTAEQEPRRLVVARRGAPLVLGLGDGENFVASDASALLQVTRDMIYLEDGDVASITPEGAEIFDLRGARVERRVQQSGLSVEAVELGTYSHFMQKEIFEQPTALANTLGVVTTPQSLAPRLFGGAAAAIFPDIDSVLILACGTSYHAGMVARYWIESIAGLPCSVEVASEYRYRASVPNPRALVVTISQSGETADTIGALQHAKSLGHVHCLSICNVAESALMRASNLHFLTAAGPEIGVASTKAFTTQLAALLLLAVVLGKLRGTISQVLELEVLGKFRRLPAALSRVLEVEPQIMRWAQRFADKAHVLFLGRGIHYPIAMEGALKLKEISYIHAEAYAAGELKHGPLALVDANMPVVAIAPNDLLLQKLKSNMQEVRARGGELYVLADADTQLVESAGLHVITLPDHAGILSPILHTIPLQLLAYHAAIARGNDVDKPRNLAKSVTVE